MGDHEFWLLVLCIFHYSTLSFLIFSAIRHNLKIFWLNSISSNENLLLFLESWLDNTKFLRCVGIYKKLTYLQTSKEKTLLVEWASLILNGTLLSFINELDWCAAKLYTAGTQKNSCLFESLGPSSFKTPKMHYTKH